MESFKLGISDIVWKILGIFALTGLLSSVTGLFYLIYWLIKHVSIKIV